MVFRYIHFDTISSTNTYLKENYSNLENGTVVSAKHQTSGRGRMNRKWYDGDDLLFSFLIKDEIKLTEVSQLALVVAASVFLTLSKYLKNISIKWPNDILINNKKICGILLESIISGNKLDCLIAGIGVNGNTENFPEEIKNKSTSLKLETNRDFDLNLIKLEILDQFANLYKNFLEGKKDYLKICKENSCLLNQEVIIDDFYNTFEGKVIDILDNGSILINVNNELKVYNYGEISLKNIYENKKR